jgi:hypothetical protein
VVRAAQAAVLVAAEPQGRAAVRAELVDEAVLALAVPEGHQALGQQLEPDRRAAVLRQLFGEARRDPVLPEQLTHRRPRAGLGEQFVDLLAQHERLLCPAPPPVTGFAVQG